MRGNVDSPFKRPPKELFECVLSFLHPLDIVSIAHANRVCHNRAMARRVWSEICFQIMSPHITYAIHPGCNIKFTKELLETHEGSFLRHLQIDPGQSQGFFAIYAQYLQQVGNFLGHWHVQPVPGSMIRREIYQMKMVFVPHSEGQFFHKVVCITGPNITPKLPNSLLEALQNHHLFAMQSIGPNSQAIDARATNERVVVKGAKAIDSPGVRYFHYTLNRIPDGVQGLSWKTKAELSSLTIPDPHLKTRDSLFNDAPVPSLGLRSLFQENHKRIDLYLPSPPSDTVYLDTDPQNPTLLRKIVLPPPPPASIPSQSIIQEGLYVAPTDTAPNIPASNGLAYARLRTLTADDFKVDSLWEGSVAHTLPPSSPEPTPPMINWSDPANHLGPFSTLFRDPRASPLQISQEHVRPGARILEVTVVTDSQMGVPSGQRSVIAFLDDPLVEKEALEAAAKNPPADYNWPASSLDCPWPIMQDAVTSSVGADGFLEKPFAPVHGIDFPGCARYSSEPGFKNPSWMHCIVHVESRDRFTVWAPDAQRAVVYSLCGEKLLVVRH